MPPKKKQKVVPRPTRVSSTPSQTPNPTRETPSKPIPEVDLSDPWTDEQETALLKAIIRWKPVGIYKDVRMMNIYQYLRSQGYASEHEQHTSIPGIWAKLATLYNLEALDEREDALMFDTDGAEITRNGRPFELPKDDFLDLQIDRANALESSDLSSSPQRSRAQDTEEPPSSPPTTGRGSRRSARGAPVASGRGTRASRAQTEAKPTARGKRKQEAQDEEMKEGSDEEEEGDGEDEEDNSNGEEEDEEEGDDDEENEEEESGEEEEGDEGGDEESGEDEEEEEEDEEDEEEEEEAASSPASKGTRSATKAARAKSKPTTQTRVSARRTRNR